LSEDRFHPASLDHEVMIANLLPTAILDWNNFTWPVCDTKNSAAQNSQV